MQPGGKNENGQSGQAIAQPPDHRIDEPFHLQLYTGGDRQVEQLGRRFVDRIAQDLVAAPQRHGGSQCAKSQQTS